ncbi:variant leucine-rich repeat-containing protein [Streptomyces cyaneofuscatus]|uniref:variant leucine-rich repeat-containing protein n=1 Tax=Streptomyces cyaneofuscatus TaxID=66883 RepID=UPI0038032F95
MNPVLHGLAVNPSLPPEAVDRLIALADDDLADILARRPDLGRDRAVTLAARAGDSAVRLAYEGRLTAADIDPVTHPQASLALLDRRAGHPEWARLFAADPDGERRAKLAACPGLPPDVVERLAADPDVHVVAELAWWATPAVAARLAQHPHAEVRRAVAANEATPAGTLAALITGAGLPPALHCLVCDREEIPFTHDPHCPRPDCDLLPGASCDGSHESVTHDTWLAALQNPVTPTGAAVHFAEHPSLLLRRALAARPDLPPAVCRRLAADPVPGVRADLAANPAIDDDLIRVLSQDRDPDVRRGLAYHPRVPLDVLTHLAGTTKTGEPLLPRIASASATETEELARSPHPAVRMLVARRRDLPAGVRDALAADPDAKVVKSIAPHPGLSAAQLRSMADRHGIRVLAQVAANPDAPPELLEELALRDPPTQKALREIARHRRATAPALLACLENGRARPVAARHPALPPPVIVGLLDDSDPQVAEAAAANPSLPPHVMLELVQQRRVLGRDQESRQLGRYG